MRGFILAIAQIVWDWLHDGRRKARLKTMLTDSRFRFGRTITQLTAGIGADLETTKRLLLTIGARPSETNADIWTMKSAPTRR